MTSVRSRQCAATCTGALSAARSYAPAGTATRPLGHVFGIGALAALAALDVAATLGAALLAEIAGGLAGWALGGALAEGAGALVEGFTALEGQAGIMSARTTAGTERTRIASG